MEKINKQQEQANKFLLSALKNLRESLSSFSLDHFVVNTLETLMLLEREEHLQSLKKANIKDKGNGTYARSFKSLSKNSIMINIPRTRYTDFKPYALEFIKYNQEQVNELVLKLYTKGLTTRDVADILTNFFGNDISYAQVSNLAERFNELRLAWENSSLQPYYKVIYCDAMYITVKREDSYSKEALHIIFGVREDNKRELLDLFVNPTESAHSWGECFQRLKKRGVETVDLIVGDGLTGLEDEVHKTFKGAYFQKCVVHKMRNILSKVRPKDKSDISQDLKNIFDNFDKTSTIQEAKEKLEYFYKKWNIKYPEIIRSLKKDTTEYYFTYIKFPVHVRRMIYTTNSIESLNKKLRKATKNKQSFEKVDRLLDYVFVVIKEFEAENWMRYPVSQFSNWVTQTQLN